MLTDLIFALRQIIRAPGYSCVVVLTLAFGIAVNSTIFGMLNVFMLQPFPGAHNANLMMVLQRSPTWPVPHQISFPDFRDYRAQTTTLESLYAYMPSPVHLSAKGKSPQRTWLEVVTPNAFNALARPAILGRTLLPSDGEKPGMPAVVVLSYDCWQNRFGSDPTIVGQTVLLNGNPFTVVGVTGEDFHGFSFFMAMSGWIPVGALNALSDHAADSLEWRTSTTWRALGKLKARATLATVRAEMAVLTTQLERDFPDSHRKVSSVVLPENRARPDPLFADYLPIFATFFSGLVILVLIIACANVANLMLARAATRQRELTLRSALGAGRGQLVRQLLIESLTLALIAGVVSWYLQDWMRLILEAFRPNSDIPISPMRAPVWENWLFTSVVAIVAGVGSGLLPALRASRTDLVENLKEGAGGRIASARHLLRNLLVVGQVMFSVVVLISAGLFLQSLRKMENVRLGFRSDHLLMATFDLTLQGYDHQRGLNFQDKLLERVRAVPGVTAASLTTYVPFDYNVVGHDIWPETTTGTLKEGSLQVTLAQVAPGFIEMFGLHLDHGRTILGSDSSKAPRVAVINKAFGDLCWPGQEAVGKRFRLWKDGPWTEVVGVTDTAKYMLISEPPRPFFYIPIAQDYTMPATLVVRTVGTPSDLAVPLKNVIAELDSHLPLFNVRTMDELMGDSMFAFKPMRIGATLAGVEGAIALFLAVMGLYAVVSFGVTQRTREIGIRIAVGGQPRDVISAVLREGLKLTAIGLGLGLLLAGGIGFALSKVLFGLAVADPLVLCTVSVGLFVTAAIACWIPARRAALMDPVSALRTE